VIRQIRPDRGAGRKQYIYAPGCYLPKKDSRLKARLSSRNGKRLLNRNEKRDLGGSATRSDHHNVEIGMFIFNAIGLNWLVSPTIREGTRRE
jgi:hypothetical protein